MSSGTPPCRSIADAASSAARRITRCTTSGSATSASSAAPATPAQRTVTTLRVSRGATGSGGGGGGAVSSTRSATGSAVGVAGTGLGRWRSERRVLIQDRAVELLQRRAGVDPELLEEPLAGVGVDGERLGLPARAVEREHQLAVEALAERVCPRQRLQLGDERVVAAAAEVGVDPVLRAGEPELVEAGDLGLRERLVEEVRECRAAPEGQA